MADSRGPLQLSALTLEDLNRVLAEIVNDLDALAGLRGSVTVYNTVTIDSTTHTVKLGATGLTITDTNGVVVHQLGGAT